MSADELCTQVSGFEEEHGTDLDDCMLIASLIRSRVSRRSTALTSRVTTSHCNGYMRRPRLRR